MAAGKKTRAIFFAVLAAALYAINAPLSKLLLRNISPTMMAALLYLGACLGMLAVSLIIRKAGSTVREESLSRKDLPFVLGMIALDIAAPIFLMLGLKSTSAANTSLLNNFEIVATSVFALMLFHETVSWRLGLAITLVSLSSVILSFEGRESLRFSSGSMLVLLACVCWGLENNCTRVLSKKNPMEIVVLKGFGSGCGALLIALGLGESFPGPAYAAGALLLGFVAYGLSIFFYVRAQRELGAAKTSTYYAIAPFIGAALSLIIFRQFPTPSFLIALGVMIAGAWLASTQGKRQAGQP
jgi:drug/metabolite transporter (DMT)-like permease